MEAKRLSGCCCILHVMALEYTRTSFPGAVCTLPESVSEMCISECWSEGVCQMPVWHVMSNRITL